MFGGHGHSRVVGLRTRRVGWTMAQRRSDTEPGQAAPPIEPGPEPEPAPATATGYRYERPPIADPEVRELLDGLKAPPFPRAVDLPETDGELAAQYQAGPHAAPARTRTPTPQPAVLFSTTQDMRVAEGPSAAVWKRRSAETTAVPVVPRRRLGWLVLAAVALASLLLAVVFVRRGGPDDAPRTPATIASPPSAPLPTPPIASDESSARTPGSQSAPGFPAVTAAVPVARAPRPTPGPTLHPASPAPPRAKPSAGLGVVSDDPRGL
jgi:hypothetical protein